MFASVHQDTTCNYCNLTIHWSKRVATFRLYTAITNSPEAKCSQGHKYFTVYKSTWCYIIHISVKQIWVCENLIKINVLKHTDNNAKAKLRQARRPKPWWHYSYKKKESEVSRSGHWWGSMQINSLQAIHSAIWTIDSLVEKVSARDRLYI